VTLAAWVVPGARRSEVIGIADGCLRVRLAAPASEGRANAELMRFVAGLLGVPKRDVVLARGQRSRRKHLLIRGVTLADAERRLGL